MAHKHADTRPTLPSQAELQDEEVGFPRRDIECAAQSAGRESAAGLALELSMMSGYMPIMFKSMPGTTRLAHHAVSLVRQTPAKARVLLL